MSLLGLARRSRQKKPLFDMFFVVFQLQTYTHAGRGTINIHSLLCCSLSTQSRSLHRLFVTSIAIAVNNKANGLAAFPVYIEAMPTSSLDG